MLYRKKNKSLDPNFLNEYVLFESLTSQTKQRFELKLVDIYPCLEDKTSITSFDAHYIYHTAWAARIIKKINPTKHFDISSFLYFSTILSAFVPVSFFDFRPANIKLPDLEMGKEDICNLSFEKNSISCLSCMHVIEHIGLGRYGDKLDYDGDLYAIRELKRVIKSGGNLLIAVPVGQPKIRFNAHRIYSYDQIISYFEELKLKEFTLIPDNANETGMIINAEKNLADAQDYGCGCFWFQK
jgi:SAM-dependent methyltransferase